MQCSCLKTYTFSFNLSWKLINSLWTLAIPKSTRTENPKSHTKCISLTRTYVKTLFETFSPIVMDIQKHDFEFISSHRYWIRSFILFISTKKDPFIHDIKNKSTETMRNKFYQQHWCDTPFLCIVSWGIDRN